MGSFVGAIESVEGMESVVAGVSDVMEGTEFLVKVVG